ncbi:uncharacterized protein N7511_003689 [Penicillium nucicola]|uniref:uncharacterized protein n=1 Tax=Penicillium nucicola TaxID=1850975 RepID=UPI002544E569|nr:uncharacterized protein N7511_003689 [Penicillium nucicola]KAJ5766073.1 hypothetical protein N7511_003689 [Penicillium nucicola]
MKVFYFAFALAGSTFALPRCTSWLEDGFQHPGIYHDCRSLDRIQANYHSNSSAYLDALSSAQSRLPALQDDATWTMSGPFESVNWAGGDGHNIPLQTDGKSAYALTIGWYATGNSLWLSRAKEIVLAWGLTLKDLNEQIQGGEGLAYMTAAAEILRASARDSGWTVENTTTWLNIIETVTAPWNVSYGIARNDFFMNQGFYENGGAMNLAVFSNNRTLYDEMVRHATIGENPDPTIDYAIPIQGHPMGTLRGLAFMGTTAHIQGGADFYNQNSSRLLAGYEYWARYNDMVPWEPKVIRPGSGEVYDKLVNISRGKNYSKYTQPLEAIGTAFHEYYRRGRAPDMPYYSSYMKWQGISWDTFEWGDDNSVGFLGQL